jgi:hypothetical protein
MGQRLLRRAVRGWRSSTRGNRRSRRGLTRPPDLAKLRDWLERCIAWSSEVARGKGRNSCVLPIDLTVSRAKVVQRGELAVEDAVIGQIAVRGPRLPLTGAQAAARPTSHGGRPWFFLEARCSGAGKPETNSGDQRSRLRFATLAHTKEGNGELSARQSCRALRVPCTPLITKQGCRNKISAL